MRRCLALLLSLMCCRPLHGAEPMHDGSAITIRDYLNRYWQNETVHYDLEFEKGDFPESREAIENIGDFMRSRLAG